MSREVSPTDLLLDGKSAAIPEGDLGFYATTLRKHGGLIELLPLTFEVLRGGDRNLKRYPSDEPGNDAARARVCGIEPKDDTRMGAPIRHLTHLLNNVEVRTKLLITLSDGKPDHYDHLYRGEYDIEDTRRAWFEARLAGIHLFCVAIDEEGADYLPHLYGAANHVVLSAHGSTARRVSGLWSPYAGPGGTNGLISARRLGSLWPAAPKPLHQFQ